LPHRTSATLAFLVLIAAGGSPVFAATLAFKCIEKDAGEPQPEMTLLYEGDASGTLKVKASFGEMVLPATKEEREAVDADGKSYTATGIRAFGPATVLMPDKAAIETCVKAKLKPEEAQDEDIVATYWALAALPRRSVKTQSRSKRRSKSAYSIHPLLRSM
jgi:hypothetical protein